MRRSGCCTVRVGDGKRSQGDCQSIEKALEQVMKRGGGRICLLPGTFEENILVASAHDIRIEGCGEQTVLMGQAPAQGGAQAAIHVRDSLTNNQAIHCMLVLPLLGPMTVPLPNTVVLNPLGCVCLNLALNGALYQRALKLFSVGG